MKTADESLAEIAKLRRRKFALIEKVKRDLGTIASLEQEECAMLSEVANSFGEQCGATSEVTIAAVAPKEIPPNDD